MTAAILKRSHDRKTTNAVTPAAASAIANAFGLPAGLSCPGRTAVCGRICYAENLERAYVGVRAVLQHNLDALQSTDRAGMVALLSGMVETFRADCARREARTGQDVPRDFRIHWDGDFFSVDYAAAWADVIRTTADVRYWVYTRSFSGAVDVLPVLAGLPNLTLYLSVDSENLAAAKAARKRNPWALWAYLGDTFTDAREATAGVSGKAYPCPENGGRLPLITAAGSACGRCGICPTGRGDVLFSIGKR